MWLFRTDRVEWLPGVRRRLEVDRRPSWSRLSQEPARRGHEHAGWRPGSTMFSHSDRKEYRADDHAGGYHRGGVPGARTDRSRAARADQEWRRRQQELAVAGQKSRFGDTAKVSAGFALK